MSVFRICKVCQDEKCLSLVYRFYLRRSVGAVATPAVGGLHAGDFGNDRGSSGLCLAAQFNLARPIKSFSEPAGTSIIAEVLGYCKWAIPLPQGGPHQIVTRRIVTCPCTFRKKKSTRWTH